MKNEKANSCAVCGAPIKPGLDLCGVCKKETTRKTAMVACRACGATNAGSAKVCSECGAPLSAETKSPSGDEVGDAVGASETVRRAELQVLEDCFDVCAEKGRGGGAIVTGESGMGVTTLLKSFAGALESRISTRRVHYVLVRDEGEPFAPLRSIVRQALDISDDDDATSARLRLTDRVGKVLGPSSAALVTECAHILGYLGGVQFPKSPVLRALEGDAELMNRRIKETFVRYFEADIRAEPTVFIFDDLQKTDDATRRLVVELTAELAAVPLVTIVGGRPSLLEITDNQKIVRVTLEALSSDLMEALLELLAPHLIDPPEELVDALLGRASGNPGSLFELLSLLRESGVIDTSGEVWQADVSRLDATDMPVNLIDALKARVNQLDPRDRQILHHAAVIGDVFWDEALAALARKRKRLGDRPDPAQLWADDSDNLSISSSLDRLVERQFVVCLPEIDIKGSIKYAFARSGIRTHILSQIDEQTKRSDHRLVAAWLAHAAAGAAGFAELEADQWSRAGETQEAARAFFRAARYARTRYLNQKAIKLFEAGLEIADPDDHLVLADVEHDLGSLWELLGEYDRAEQHIAQMLRHAWVLAHRGKAGAALNKIGRLYRERGDGAAARAFLNRGMTLFSAAGDERGVAACLADLGELARRHGKHDQAFRQVSEALELQRGLKNRLAVAFCLQSLGHIEAARSNYGQAEKHLEEALTIRQEQGEKGGMAQTLSTLAIVLFNRGRLEQAIARWEAAQGLAEEVGDRRLLAIVHNNLGEAHRDQGNLERAMQHFKACENMVEALGARILQAEVTRNIGILHHKMGDREKAREYLDRSLEISRDHGVREMEGLALRALGGLEADTMWDTSNVDGEDAAEAIYEQALEIFEQSGNGFETARTLHAMGNRHLERGDLKGGRQLLEQAMEIFDRIESQAGEQIARTIREIIGDMDQGKPPEPDKKKSSFALSIRNRLRSARETFPDLTDELELLEEE